jgi:hypothetical protein
VGPKYLDPRAGFENRIVQVDKRSLAVEFWRENNPIYLVIKVGSIANHFGIGISSVGYEESQQALALMIFGEVHEDSLNKYLWSVCGVEFFAGERYGSAGGAG